MREGDYAAPWRRWIGKQQKRSLRAGCAAAWPRCAELGRGEA